MVQCRGQRRVTWATCVTAGLLLSAAAASAEIVSFTPLVNEVSAYLNVLDDGEEAGQTLQVIAINSIKLGWSFDIELTADFNHQQSEEDFDYYLEAGIVKPIWRGLKVNVQRIHGTFIPEPINQFGIRYSF
ncbi:hypothetical protein AMJ39_07065 [candidate division TA06 bacterium DG_24]|jgi:hypothetical protein|uniref:Uncharacterized protein n=3 Tax=Bacteria division TA06 TaxID=1156500 RepID=A0A0S8JHA2_UNCT6|nr:MAG: hypothetical protein AMJ39_07065 [candidate division TA06 bacterium DG_24]KPK68148.1 MAG: hypothetical protein AMJ82_08970 [candidate division TA06 bacterium SM23_40]KPL08928.1 MAG: hypothetical protein AMJ71_07765 [candidate division TA06 bacterium SM1_40]